ncbi:MAG TPA: glycosyltransferase family 4 protein [Baekduia sp.]|nr:glycosyltransferase family 4 protein [Baekduia sp.]
MRLTVASSFPIHPPRGGGQERIAGLYRAMGALGAVVEIVTLAERRERRRRIALGPGVTEVRVPMSPAFERADLQLKLGAGIPATDLALVRHHDLAPEFGEALRESARDADAVVASHPFALDALQAATDRPLVYEAHNVEADLKEQMLAGSPAAAELTALAEDVERRAVAAARVVFVCSEQDRARLQERYGLDPARTAMVPNGADPATVPYTAPQVRAALRRRLGLAGRHAMFVGSWHEPNLVAVRAILDAAPALEDVRWLVLGSVGQAFADVEDRPQVDLAGPVDQRFLEAVLRIADVAVNPMRTGSGTNLKMLTYALAGVPIVSSPTGARGLGFEAGRHHLEAAPDDLGSGVRAVLQLDPDRRRQLVEAARDHVLERFSWPGIARRTLDDVLRPAFG